MPYDPNTPATHLTTMGARIREARDRLDPAMRQRPWAFVDYHGTQPLENDTQRNAYLAAYGEMHETKLRAALQNFPFDTLTRIQVVDWGCGQGVGTLTLIDMLRERGRLACLDRVDLVEPSLNTMQRAAQYIGEALGNKTPIFLHHNWMPGRGKGELTAMDYTRQNVVHLFSNVLDIADIDLAALARLVAAPGHTHHIVCTGPMNAGSGRIDTFCQMFEGGHMAGRIDSPAYATTSYTHHTFSCVAHYLRYEGPALAATAPHTATTPWECLDDYDSRLALQNGVITEPLRKLYDKLQEALPSDVAMFLRPDIGGDTPDLVLIRPKCALIIINVYEQNAEEIATPERFYELLGQLRRLDVYRGNMIEAHVEGMLEKALTHKDVRETVRCVAWFPNVKRTSTLLAALKAAFHEQKIAQPKAHINFGADLLTDQLFMLTGNILATRRLYFDDEICRGCINALATPWHPFTPQSELVLTTAQKRLIDSQARRQKVSSMAGTGKTEVLARMAVQAQLRTGKRVLIITYNLTLTPYIHYRIQRVSGDFPDKAYYITNYHQFFRTQAVNHGLPKDHPLQLLTDCNNPHFFDEVETQRFATILIDEVQDFRQEWTRLLYDKFLEDDGSIIVFGDGKQNIYKMPQDARGDIRLGIIGGVWNKSLQKAFRFQNTHIAEMALRFQQHFFPETDTDALQPERQLALHACEYRRMARTATPEEIELCCADFIARRHLVPASVAVLAQTTGMVRAVEQCHRLRTGEAGTITCEREETYQALACTANSNQKEAERDLIALRRSKKLFFTTGTQRMKFATTQSFKGWDIETVVLIIAPVHSSQDFFPDPGLVYTAMTRARQNLLVINCGYDEYNDFFQRECQDGGAEEGHAASD